MDCGVNLGRTVCLEEQDIIRSELISQFHARTAQWHSGNCQPDRICWLLVQKALDQIGGNMTLEYESISRNGRVTGLILRGNAALQFLAIQIRRMADLSNETAFRDMINPQRATAAAGVLEHVQRNGSGLWRGSGIHCISFAGSEPETNGE